MDGLRRVTSPQPAPPPSVLDWTRHALFLDFDGTLAPLVARPEDVVMAASTRELISTAMRVTDGAVAVISGRALDDLAGMLGPLSPAMSGSHGAEVRLTGGDAQSGSIDGGARDGAFADLSDMASDAGLLLERKPGAVALHYRNRPELERASIHAVTRAARQHGLRAMHGNMVSEAALAGIDKGSALRAFMEQPPFHGRVPVMIGDDTTDEDGFAAAQEMGGAGLRIGGTETCARYRVATMEAALAWLGRTLERAA